jgi:NCS1 family nucleobase:cation symporter-1
MIAWIGSVVAGLVASYLGWIHLFFVFIPVWILAAITYLVLAGLFGARGTLPEGVDIVSSHAPPAGDAPKTSTPAPDEDARHTVAIHASGRIAGVSLVACLAVPLWMFATNLRTDLRMTVFGAVAGLATLVYFVSATIWLGENEKRRKTAM